MKLGGVDRVFSHEFAQDPDYKNLLLFVGEMGLGHKWKDGTTLKLTGLAPELVKVFVGHSIEKLTSLAKLDVHGNKLTGESFEPSSHQGAVSHRMNAPTLQSSRNRSES